jgi:hypothetical protein
LAHSFAVRGAPSFWRILETVAEALEAALRIAPFDKLKAR